LSGTTKRQRFQQEVKRFKGVLGKRQSEYLRFLLARSGG